VVVGIPRHEVPIGPVLDVFTFSGMPDQAQRSSIADDRWPALTPEDTVVLLAEDEPRVRNLLQFVLSEHDYVVLTASDGQEALEVSEQFKGPIHLLLTDVRMPRLDGWTLAEAVRQQRPDTKIIVISGETAERLAEDNPADAFLRKPFLPCLASRIMCHDVWARARSCGIYRFTGRRRLWVS
jgi:CheY-like chemotaxis protein